MKKGILLLVVTSFLYTISFADQLAYLSKKDADRGAEFIEKIKKIALFCGCCDNAEVEKIKVKGAEVKFTGYEDYYEIHILYMYHGETKSTPVDLAYVWVNMKGKIQTVGQALGLEHDPCKTPSW